MQGDGKRTSSKRRTPAVDVFADNTAVGDKSNAKTGKTGGYELNRPPRWKKDKQVGNKI